MGKVIAIAIIFIVVSNYNVSLYDTDGKTLFIKKNLPTVGLNFVEVNLLTQGY